MTKPLKTIADVAAWQNVTRRAVEAWAAKPGWPERTPAGNYTRAAITKFLRERRLGEFNQRDNSTRGANATKRLIIERTENLRIKKQRAQAEFERELQGLVFRKDVEKLFSVTRKTVLRVVKQQVDDVAASLPEALPEDYAEIRQRTMDSIGCISRKVAEAMQEASFDG